MRKRGGKLGSRQQPTCIGAGLDPAVFLEVAWYVLIGKAANTNLKKKKKKKEETCLPGHGVSLLPARSQQHSP